MFKKRKLFKYVNWSHRTDEKQTNPTCKEERYSVLDKTYPGLD